MYNNFYIYSNKMPRKCPPGVFCINNVSLVILVGVIAISLYVYIKNEQLTVEKGNSTDKIVIVDRDVERRTDPYFTNPNYMMSRNQGQVYLNPYAPPLKHNFFFSSLYDRYLGGRNTGDIRGVPINIPTSNYDLNFRQIGILTRATGVETILALFGRPVHSNRNKWQYYTMTDKNNSIKLPISKGGRSCTDEYGCDEIYNGDSVYVEGYNDAFKATIYENNTPRYIPM
jgi:hypothetical protein